MKMEQTMAMGKWTLLKAQWSWGIVILVFLTGCAVPATMRVRSFPNPKAALLEYNRFDLKPGDSERPLEEAHILEMVKEVLTAQGFVEDIERPQFYVQVIFGQEEKEKIEGIRTYQVERPVRRIRRSDGSWRYVYGGDRTYVEGGGTIRYNSRHLRIIFFDAKSPDEKPIWEGEVVSNGRSDLFTVTRCLLEGLLTEFPHRTGVVVKRFDDRCLAENPVD